MHSMRRSFAARLAACLAACALALAAAALARHATGPAARDTARPGLAQTYRAAADDAALSLAAAAAPAGGCSYHQIAGGYQWVCSNTVTSPGTQSSGHGSGSKPTCTLTPLSQQQAQYLGLQWPAPKGHTWDAITCVGAQPFGGVVLAGGTPAAPTVTPQQLVQIAVSNLIFPALPLQTAPPVGKDGLVGLPEWFWVPPASWQPVQSPPAVAGPVWAIAIATPESMVIDPGGGLPPVSCPGSGTAYNPALSSSAQHSDCSYTYDQPSTGQPGNAYQATVTVVWKVSWIGSGDSHGNVTDDWPVSTAVTVPVAAGQALVTGR
jgi:hypothetical protein